MTVARSAALVVSTGVVRHRRGLFQLARSLVMLPLRIASTAGRLFLFTALLPLRVVRGAAKAAVRVSLMPLRFVALWMRLMRLRGILLFVVGFAAGMLLTPWPGRVLREKVRNRLTALTPPDDEALADTVRSQLAGAPRTWHLDQPEVSVVSGSVTLVGLVATETSRDEFIRLASTVAGVTGVEADGLVVPSDDVKSRVRG